MAPAARTTTASTATRVNMASGEFDHLLGEKTSDFVSNVDGQPSRVRTVLRVPDGSDLVTLTSSVAADPSASGDQFYDAVEDSMKAYLSWEVGLMEQIERDGTTNFKPFDPSV